LIFGGSDLGEVAASVVETQPRIGVTAQQVLNRLGLRLRQERCTEVCRADGIRFLQHQVATVFIAAHGDREGEAQQQRENPEQRALNTADLTLARFVFRHEQAQTGAESSFAEREEQQPDDYEDHPLVSKDEAKNFVKNVHVRTGTNPPRRVNAEARAGDLTANYANNADGKKVEVEPMTKGPGFSF